jgi:hypothetical protein
MFMRTLVAFGVAISLSVNAAEYGKETTLESVGAHGARPAHPALENNDFIALSAGVLWSASGGATCSETSVVLPTNNPTMRAIALAAIASGAVVWITVDSSLPMVAGACQVTTIYVQRGQ